MQTQITDFSSFLSCESILLNIRTLVNSVPKKKHWSFIIRHLKNGIRLIRWYCINVRTESQLKWLRPAYMRKCLNKLSCVWGTNVLCCASTIRVAVRQRAESTGVKNLQLTERVIDHLAQHFFLRHWFCAFCQWLPSVHSDQTPRSSVPSASWF